MTMSAKPERFHTISSFSPWGTSTGLLNGIRKICGTKPSAVGAGGLSTINGDSDTGVASGPEKVASPITAHGSRTVLESAQVRVNGREINSGVQFTYTIRNLSIPGKSLYTKPMLPLWRLRRKTGGCGRLHTQGCSTPPARQVSSYAAAVAYLDANRVWDRNEMEATEGLAGLFYGEHTGTVDADSHTRNSAAVGPLAHKHSAR